MNNNFLEHALKYAVLGWKVFPLCAGQKIPLPGTHGVKDATSDEQTIRAWWAKYPNANIAVACGETSGIYVIDVDVSADGSVNGLESLKEFPQLPDTVKQLTPRGGFHGFFKSAIAPANRNSFRPGIDIRGTGYYVVLAPSVHPNGGIYYWCPGCGPGEHVITEYPDFMRPVTRAPWASKPGDGPVLAYGNSTPATSDALQRASLYLAQCDPAIQGQGGHDKLLYAAGRLVKGFDLSDDQAYDLLAREYNPMCVPPWNLADPKDEKDFRRKISEARRLPSPNPPGWLLNDPAYAPVDVSGIKINELLAKQPARVERAAPCAAGPPLAAAFDSKELNFLCRPTGLLGELCSWINSTALKEQPFLSLACSLTFLGVLFGRKIKDGLGSRTNLYCMGIAPSSAGKAHAMNQIRRLSDAAGCTDLLGGADIASDSAIEDRVSRHPATLFLWDEIGHLLCHIKSGVSRHHAQVVSLLMQLYSAAGNVYLGREYAEQEKQRNIIQPCCGIYGTSTPERFASGISPEELQDGWLSRCLAFYSSSDPEKNREVTEQPVPLNLIEKVGQWYRREFQVDNDGHTVTQFITPSMNQNVPEQMIVPIEPKAEKIFTKFDDETRKYGKEFPLLKCLWAKGEENARRVALIVAGGECFESPKITDGIADYSCRLLRYLLNDFSRVIAPEVVSSATESYKRKLITIIEQSGIDGIKQGTLSRATQWANRKQREDLLNDLVESEEIVRNGVKETTKTVLYYWTAGNYQRFLEKGK